MSVRSSPQSGGAPGPAQGTGKTSPTNQGRPNRIVATRLRLVQPSGTTVVIAKVPAPPGTNRAVHQWQMRSSTLISPSGASGAPGSPTHLLVKPGAVEFATSLMEGMYGSETK